MAAAALHRGHILVVDDDRAFRDLMRTLLERAGFEVREAIDGGDAIAAAQLTRPSLVLLDVLLPGISGYEVLRALHETIDEDLAIILMSGERSGREDVVAALLLGADDYLVKPFRGDELLARIRRSLRRHRPVSPSTNGAASVLDTLTAREAEVLAFLAEGFTQADIAVRLVVSPRTVGTHIQHILAKLDVHNRAQAVALALRPDLRTGGVASDGVAHSA